MKLFVSFVFLAFVLLGVSGHEENFENFNEELQHEEDRSRHLETRVTCDLLSIQIKGFAFNHAACATSCIFKRRKGGSCVNGVCQCR